MTEQASGQGAPGRGLPDAFVQAVSGAVAQLGWELLRWEEDCVVCRDPGE